MSSSTHRTSSITVDLIARYKIKEPVIMQRLKVIMQATENFFLSAFTTEQQKEGFKGAHHYDHSQCLCVYVFLCVLTRSGLAHQCWTSQCVLQSDDLYDVHSGWFQTYSTITLQSKTLNTEYPAVTSTHTSHNANQLLPSNYIISI